MLSKSKKTFQEDPEKLELHWSIIVLVYPIKCENKMNKLGGNCTTKAPKCNSISNKELVRSTKASVLATTTSIRRAAEEAQGKILKYNLQEELNWICGNVGNCGNVVNTREHTFTRSLKLLWYSSMIPQNFHCLIIYMNFLNVYIGPWQNLSPIWI